MAIAFDASSDGGLVNPGTSLTWSHTVTGSNPILFVGLFGDLVSGDATGNKITGVTYNSVAMTEVGRIAEDNGNNPGAERWVYLFVLVGPATGAHNVVISASSSIAILGLAVSYTGATQSGQPDASATNSTFNSSITTSVTTVADNCWTVIVAKSNAADVAAGTGSTQRVLDGLGMYDSNAAITPAGSYSMTINTSPSTSAPMAAVMASFSPSGAAAVEQPIEKRHGGVPFMSGMQLRGGVRGGVW